MESKCPQHVVNFWFVFIRNLFTLLSYSFFIDKKNAGSAQEASGWGELLLLISLTLDGMTGASQEKMRAEFSTKAHAMMFAVNKWSAVYLGAAILFTGEIFR